MVMPNFFIIGAAKSGTTTIYHYLKQHHQVYMNPVKETNFFAYEGEELACEGPGADYINNSIVDPAAYAALFAGASAPPASFIPYSIESSL